MADITKLICPSCGGKLELANDDNRFTCSFCGNQLQVERKAGEIEVKPLIHAVKTMQGSMDRTASEMAINRIKSEIEKLEAQRNPYKESWSKLQVIHNKPQQYKLWRTIFLWSFLAFPILFILGLVVDKPGIAIIGIFILFMAIIGLVINGNNTRNRKTAEKDYEKMVLFIVPLNEQLDKKNRELEKHLKIIENDSLSY